MSATDAPTPATATRVVLATLRSTYERDHMLPWDEIDARRILGDLFLPEHRAALRAALIEAGVVEQAGGQRVIKPGGLPSEDGWEDLFRFVPGEPTPEEKPHDV